MGVLEIIAVVALAVLAVGAVALISCLTVKHLRESRIKKDNTKIVTKMSTVIGALKKEATKVSFNELEELEKMEKESPYVVAEYDPDTDKVVKVERAKDADKQIQSRLENSETGVIEVYE